MNACLDGPAVRASEVAMFRSEFLRYAAQSDLTQPCPAGSLIHDWKLEQGETRRETIAEVIGGELCFGDAMTTVITLICRAAKGQSIEADAVKLLTGLADGWADRRSEL